MSTAAWQREWRAKNPHKAAYIQHKSRAKQCGIEFKLTEEEWIAFWGDDFELRGLGKYDLCMCRYGDTGPYEVGNVYKATRSDNLHHKHTGVYPEVQS